MLEVVTILFPDFETLDVFGPVEIFGRLRESFQPEFYSRDGGLVISTQNVKVSTRPVSEMDDSKSDFILFIPGGHGTRQLVNDQAYVDMLKALAGKAEYVFTVCTGSTLFAKTGLLDGKRATSNKRAFEWTKTERPEVNWVNKARWVKDGKTYTSSGVSAGMDMALGFVSDLVGYDTAKRISNEIEYDWHENPDWDPFADLYQQ
mmetsp:Transcript_2760/g.3499  ORF Transcript_2760/g.3499 Transcript_2760/m.3499 type:complete len:204 (-) Transcript_2760:35-646(-)